MTKLTKSLTALAFIDYKPAEIRRNKDWMIVFYAKEPSKDKLKLFRVRVPKIKNKAERNKVAKKLELSINKKLATGWSPFYEDTKGAYKTIDFIFTNYIKTIEKEVEEGVKRQDTLRSYKSIIKIFLNYLKEHHTHLKFIIEIDLLLVNQFMDHVYMERDVSATTYNNYLRFLNIIFNFCISKGYTKQNPAENIKPKKKQQKIRQQLGVVEKNKLKKLENNNFHFYVLCMCTYYCFIRRTEMTKLKVSDVNLKAGFITINNLSSKNKKTENVTIPKSFYPLLIKHLSKAVNNDYLFSANFKTGDTQLNPKKISDEWDRFRKKYDIENKYQFYSLKETGITDLLNTGIPSIKVRDQARHHDLKITELYTSRNETFDNDVKNASFEF